MARFTAGFWGCLLLIGLGISSASARMYYLPDYQNATFPKRVNDTSKEETIYSKLNGDNKIYSTIVTSKINNDNREALIDDVSDENEIVCLEVYKITINAVELYAHKFKTDGVEKEDMETVLERIRNDLEELETTTDKTIEMKRDIMGHFENATFSIDKAYEED